VCHLEEAFTQPWAFSDGAMEDRLRVQVLLEQGIQQRKKAAVEKWRQILNERAAKGAKEAFQFMRQADVPHKAIGSLGVGQLLKPAMLWAGLRCRPPAADDDDRQESSWRVGIR
jgi:hypothetical protein